MGNRLRFLWQLVSHWCHWPQSMQNYRWCNRQHTAVDIVTNGNEVSCPWQHRSLRLKLPYQTSVMLYSTDNRSNLLSRIWCKKYINDKYWYVVGESWILDILAPCKLSYFCFVVVLVIIFCLHFLIGIVGLQVKNVQVTPLSSGTEVNVRWDPVSYQPPGIIFIGYMISYR